MTARPGTSPLFATDATLGTGTESALSPRLDPGAGIRARGLLANTRAPARWFNFELGPHGDWLNYFDQKSAHVFNLLNYGADPTAGSDATTAIQNAAADAYAVSGALVVPPGIYKASGLVLPPVDIYGVSGASWLIHSSPTANQLSFSTYNDGPAAIISGIRFVSQVVTTGTSIANSAGARVVFDRCSWNGFEPGGAPSSDLQGKLVRVNSADAELTFIDCRLEAAGNVKALHATAGKIKVVRGMMSMPATYADALAYVDGTGDIALDDVFCNCTAHATGAAQVLSVGVSTARGALRDGTIDATGAGASLTAALWVPDALVNVRLPRLLGNVSPYGTNQAAIGSRVQLDDTIAVDIGTNSTVDLTSFRRYRSVLISGHNTSGCAVTLAPGIFPGQPLEFTYFNAASNSMNVTFAGTSLTAGPLITVNPIPAGATLTGVFVWESRDVSGTYRWVQKGTWGIGSTVV